VRQHGTSRYARPEARPVENYFAKPNARLCNPLNDDTGRLGILALKARPDFCLRPTRRSQVSPTGDGRSAQRANSTRVPFISCLAILSASAGSRMKRAAGSQLIAIAVVAFLVIPALRWTGAPCGSARRASVHGGRRRIASIDEKETAWYRASAGRDECRPIPHGPAQAEATSTLNFR